MKIKCDLCGNVGTKYVLYHGKYAALSDETIIDMSSRGKLYLACNVCHGIRKHCVVLKDEAD